MKLYVIIRIFDLAMCSPLEISHLTSRMSSSSMIQSCELRPWGCAIHSRLPHHHFPLRRGARLSCRLLDIEK
ncbi:alcohol dehydrogenase [Histoplasma capsulatum var. duboisii H88]|uniref:Alcohol dehydrogenase n=1 Tax=Ajellomyces capsulatus (strain H88) TaxID=544711 RepID=A0A8A1LM03_AJEC8|nr:alcohol dehydrogenase [Histoplasma capsulatum var. duboisii H88]